MLGRIGHAARFQRRRAQRHQPEGLLGRLKVPPPDGQHAVVGQVVVVVQKGLGGV